MNSKEIIERYHLIEYLSPTDNIWYKLKDYYPFCFSHQDDLEIIVLDTGSFEGADLGYFKINDGKLFRQNYKSQKFVVLNDIRFLDGDLIETKLSSITAIGKLNLINKPS